MVWINALVASAGGEIIKNVRGRQGRDPVDRLARRRRGRRDRRRSWPGSAGRTAGMSTATEEEARSVFQGDRGMFMVNWPYVYRRRKPRRRRPAPSASPSSTTSAGPATPGRSRASRASRRSAGINLAIGEFTKHPDQALAAVKCITSLAEQHPVHGRLREPGRPSGAAYDDPQVREAFPMADADPRLDQRRRSAPDHAVLRRRVDVGAAHLAPAIGVSRPRRPPRRPTPTWPTS